MSTKKKLTGDQTAQIAKVAVLAHVPGADTLAASIELGLLADRPGAFEAELADLERRAGLMKDQAAIEAAREAAKG